MDDKFIKSKGYVRYPPIAENKNVSDLFQKRFVDDKGIKYFITIKKWDFSPYRDRYHPDLGIQYEADIQLHYKENGQAINITFLAGWELDEIEKHAEELFSSGKYNYYEVNGYEE